MTLKAVPICQGQKHINWRQSWPLLMLKRSDSALSVSQYSHKDNTHFSMKKKKDVH